MVRPPAGGHSSFARSRRRRLGAHRAGRSGLNPGGCSTNGFMGDGRSSMTAHSGSPGRSALAGIASVVFVLLVLPALDGRDLRAAPGAESGATCPRGTDQTRRLPVWYVQNGTATPLRWYDRPYIVHLPPTYDGTVPFPVVVDPHGSS